MEFLDDVRDCFADARNFAETPLRDDLAERQAQCEKIIGRARIGFRPERVAAAECASCPNSRSKTATANASRAVIYVNARAHEPARAASMELFRWLGLRRQVRISGPFAP